MQRAWFFSIGAAAAMAAFGWLLVAAPALAENEARPAMVAIVVDTASTREVENGVPLMESFFSLVTRLRDGNDIVFVSTEFPGAAMGPFRASDADFGVTVIEIERRLRGVNRSMIPHSIPEALEESRSILAGHGAPASSTVYVALGNDDRAAFDRWGDITSPLVDRMQDEGWIINGISLSPSNEPAERFLQGVSAPTGGRLFSLASGAELKPLADHLLSRGIRGSLYEVASRNLVGSDVLNATIAVKPGASEVTLFFFKDGETGSFRLTNPNGDEVSEQDRSAAYVIETMNLSIWRLVDPVPGDWKVESSGAPGEISIWSHATNSYELSFSALSPLPVGKASHIAGYAMRDGRAAIFENARMFAEISAPGASSQVYELLDNGVNGDAEAGDGFYSATLHTIDRAGTYDVILELVWPEWNHKITSDYSFEAQVFPSLSVERSQTDMLMLGEPTKVGELAVHVDGGPYPVDVDSVKPLMATNASDKGTIDLVPHRLYGEGPAWQYDVIFTPREQGPYSLKFEIELDYAGRLYSARSDAIVLVTEPAPLVSESGSDATAAAAVVAQPSASAPSVGSGLQTPPVAAGAAAAVSQAVAAGASGVASQPDASGILAPSEGSAFPWPLAAGLIAAALLLAAIVLFFLSRPKPYGYIYTEDERELVDFSQLRRSPTLGILYKGLVRGSELNVPGLEGVVFQFLRNKVHLRSFVEQSTVRVNNQPLIDSATIEDQTWIGTGGKLYTFLLSPKREQEPEPAGAD